MTTTTKSPAKATHILCEQSTCDGDACAPSQKKRSVGNSTLDSLVKRGEPDNGEPPGPEDYKNSVNDFVAGEVILGYHATEGFIDAFGTVVKHASLAMGDVTTSGSVAFGNKVEHIAIFGLYGCTSVIAVSKKGVFVSHTYEEHMEDLAPTFQEQVIQGIHRGLGNDYHPFGLDELRNNPGARPDGIGTIFGDNRPDADNNLDVHVYIVTPRPRVPLFQTNRDGTQVWTPDNVRMDMNALAGQTQYTTRVIELFQNLEGSFEDVGGAIIDVVDYAPNVLPRQWYDDQVGLLRDVQNAPAGKRKDAAQKALDDHRASIPVKLGDRDNTNPRGKVLVQYSGVQVQRPI